MAVCYLSTTFSTLFLPSKTSPRPHQPTCLCSLSSHPRWSPLVALTASPSPSPLPLCGSASASESDVSATAIAYPALAYSNTLCCKSTYNVQVIVGDDEPEEKVLSRFRKAVLNAGVIQECRRRRFFENNRDKKKRKTREASRRNRTRKPKSRARARNKHEAPKKITYDEEDDNWEFSDVDLPYL